VERKRIHYPLALLFAGQADSAQLRDTIRRLATDLDKHKRQTSEGKRHTALARLQKDYDALQREKEALEDAVEAMQVQLLSVGEENASKQLKMLQKVIRNLEEEVMQERSKHQRYVNKKTEEMRALMQELGELRSSERTLRSRVKNLTNELTVLKKSLRSSPSSFRVRRSPSSFQKTPSSTLGSRGQRLHSNTGSLERRQCSGSHERKPAVGFSGGRTRMRTPSPRGGRYFRFNPSAYIENKRKQQKDINERFQRQCSPSFHGRGTHSRSNSLEKVHRTGSGGRGGGVRPPVQRSSGSGSRRLWGENSARTVVSNFIFCSRQTRSSQKFCIYMHA
jgi:coiled-coil domain-containing protein 61